MIKEAITVFFNDGDDDKTCDEGSIPQSGQICIFWAAKKVRHKNAIFSQGMQNHDILAQCRYIRYAIHAAAKARG